MPIGQYIISRDDAGYTHAQAQALAVAHGGTLAAVTSLAENTLILSFLAQDNLLLNHDPRDNATYGPWIGLTQSAGASEPDGGWTWDTGEGYDFTAWYSGQPDNFLGDSFALYASLGGPLGWGDHINDPVTAGFGAVVSAAIEVTAQVKTLVGTNGHDFIWGGDIGNTVRGLGGDDIVQGNGGKDKIIGGSGFDVLTGGAGADKLTGGTQADAFVFVVAGDSKVAAHDTITDFSEAEHDVIDFSQFDAIPGGAQDHLSFIGTSAFTGKGQVRVETVGSETHVLVNLTGNTDPEMMIVLSNGAAVDALAFAL